MTHESMRELIALRLYGEIDAGERERLERHLGTCAECRAYASEIEAGLGALAGGTHEALELPGDWPERLREATREARRRAPIPVWWAAVASFAAGVLAAAMIGRGGTDGPASAPQPGRIPTTWERFHGEAPPPLATSEGQLARLGGYLRR